MFFRGRRTVFVVERKRDPKEVHTEAGGEYWMRFT